MRICYLSDMRSPHTKRWTDHFVKEHEVHLISFDCNETSAMFPSDYDYEEVGVQLHKIQKTPLAMLMSPLIVRSLLKRIDPDILHAHFLTHYGFLAAASGFHPYVVSPWGSDITRDVSNSKIFKFTVKYGLRHADVVHCMDASFADRMKFLIGQKKTVKVIGEGIDPLLFTPSTTQHLNRNVLCLRKSQPPYNITILLHAMPIVIAEHENVVFTLLASGTDLQDTISTINDLGVGGNVRFIDVMPNREVHTTLNEACIYVDTFYNDIPGSGIGKTALEAMCCGLPVILSDSAGSELHIQHKHNGYIYTGNDSDSLANAIIELLDNQPQRLEIRENARKYVLIYQNFTENMKAMEQCYAELIQK